MTREQLRRRGPEIGLTIGAIAFLVLNVVARRHDYFFYDSYEIVLHRYSLGDLLEPTNGHPMIMWLPLVYLMREIFGLGSSMPYEIVAMLAMIAAACVVYGYLSARVDRWFGLLGATLLLFLGAGSDILFWPFQLAFAGSVGAGVGAIWALDRETPRRDLLAAALLVASVFFLAVGLAFVAAAIVAVGLTTWPRGRRAILRRLALVTGPALFLYLVWYLAYGHHSPSRLSLDNLIGAPQFVLEGSGASVAFLVGLAGAPGDGAALSWGLPLLAGFIGLAVWRFAAGPPVSARIAIPLVGALVFWFLTAINKPVGGQPDAGRYCFVAAVFLLAITAELVRGVRWGRPLAAVAAALLLISLVGNLAGVRYGRDVLGNETRTLRANLTALEIARDSVDPKFALTPEISGSDFEIVVDARSYFKSKRRYGSPALSEAELLEAPEPLRVNADRVLRAALPVTLTVPAPGAAAGRCEQLRAGTPSGSLDLRSGRLWLRAGGEGTELALRRFAAEDAPIGGIESGQTGELTIPTDRSPAPWLLTLTRGEAKVCSG